MLAVAGLSWLAEMAGWRRCWPDLCGSGCGPRLCHLCSVQCLTFWARAAVCGWRRLAVCGLGSWRLSYGPAAATNLAGLSGEAILPAACPDSLLASAKYYHSAAMAKFRLWPVPGGWPLVTYRLTHSAAVFLGSRHLAVFVTKKYY
jgi:hypothetical protein